MDQQAMPLTHGEYAELTAKLARAAKTWFAIQYYMGGTYGQTAADGMADEMTAAFAFAANLVAS